MSHDSLGFFIPAKNMQTIAFCKAPLIKDSANFLTILNSFASCLARESI